MSINRRPIRYAHSEGHTDLCYTDDGSHMITCGNDGDIRLWSGVDDVEPDSFCVGQQAFSVAQKGENIYVCSGDSKVMILKYPEGERNGILTRFTAPATHITVSKNNQMVACVSEDFSVKIFNTFNDDSITFTEMKGPALGVTISPNENLLAASCGDGNVYVWNIEEKKLLKSFDCVPTCNCFTSAKVLCRGSFNSDSKLFAYPNGKEVIIVNTDQYEKVYSLNTDKVESPFSIVQFSPCGAYITASTTNGDICIWRCHRNSQPVVSIHEQKYNICALAWNPEDNTELSFCDINGQLGTIEFISGHSDQSIPDKLQDAEIEAIGFDDDDDEDNENAISLEKLKNDTMGLLSPSANSSEAPSRAQSPERPRSPPCTLQPPFQPGSTPVHLTQRFMTFNDVGFVKLHNEEEDSTIDVQFHDATLHKNIFMKNHLNHTMASLSSSVLALACETPSKLVCIPLKSSSKEWSTELSDLEEILCITASNTIVAAATNVRMLRIFSVFGSQRAVISIPGPVVSVASFKNYIFVVYHACTANAKDQNVSGLFVELDGLNVSSHVTPVPITPLSNLMWIGFTDVGSLASYDSAGILRICKLKSGTWIPACDTTEHAKGASDSYFLIHVTESNQTIRVIHCKGSMYPATTPLPLLIELPLRIPFCEMDTDKSQLEDKLFRWTYFETDQPEKTYKETAIKLFALACRNNLDDRAFELLEILNSPQLLNIALKYANKLGRSRLVERLSDLLRKLQGQDSKNDENNPNLSVRPVFQRLPKPPKVDRSQSVESQPPFTPEVLTNKSLLEDMTPKDDSLFLKTNTKNPFLKSVNGEQRKSPFNLTRTPNTKDNALDGSHNIGTNDSSSSSQNMTVNEGETFQVWFKKQKPELQKQNPDMAVENLAKFALKLYKKQAEKRKASAEAEGSSQKSKQPKLSAFAFSK